MFPGFGRNLHSKENRQAHRCENVHMVFKLGEKSPDVDHGMACGEDEKVPPITTITKLFGRGGLIVRMGQVG